MGLVIPSSESNSDVDFFATRGFSAPGISKFGAGIQVGRLAYRTGKWAYKRYFGYATKTRSRSAGTGAGAGIGLAGGIIGAIQTRPTPSQLRKARKHMEFSKSQRFRGSNYRNCIRRPKPFCKPRSSHRF